MRISGQNFFGTDYALVCVVVERVDDTVGFSVTQYNYPKKADLLKFLRTGYIRCDHVVLFHRDKEVGRGSWDQVRDALAAWKHR